MTQAEKKTEKKTKTATHTQLAREYASKHYTDTMYGRGQYYRYGGGVWEPLHDKLIEGDIWRLLEVHEGKGIRPTSNMMHSVLKCISSKLFVREEEIDAAENLICLKNGVYDLKTQKLHPHSPDYYLTTQLPFEYSADAQAITWQMYLMSTFVKPRSVEFDKELAEFVQEAIGYSLTTSVRFHATFWCIGEGANGKGVLFHVLEQLAGSACVPLNVGILGREQYQLATLAGRRVAVCMEADATKNLVADSYVKMLVAGDSMVVRQIRQVPFKLEPKCKLWWSMNEAPAIADTSKGFWRRIYFVPFNRSFEKNEQILDLKERLEGELPGIFNWAMDGLRRLNDRGRFVIPGQVQEQTEQYRRESNPVELFVDDKCFRNPDTSTQSSRIYEEYNDWCKTNNFRPHSSKNFKNEMERLGFRHKKESAFNVFIGVGLNIP